MRRLNSSDCARVASSAGAMPYYVGAASKPEEHDDDKDKPDDEKSPEKLKATPHETPKPPPPRPAPPKPTPKPPPKKHDSGPDLGLIFGIGGGLLAAGGLGFGAYELYKHLHKDSGAGTGSTTSSSSTSASSSSPSPHATQASAPYENTSSSSTSAPASGSSQKAALRSQLLAQGVSSTDVDKALQGASASDIASSLSQLPGGANHISTSTQAYRQAAAARPPPASRSSSTVYDVYDSGQVFSVQPDGSGNFFVTDTTKTWQQARWQNTNLILTVAGKPPYTYEITYNSSNTLVVKPGNNPTPVAGATYEIRSAGRPLAVAGLIIPPGR